MFGISDANKLELEWSSYKNKKQRQGCEMLLVSKSKPEVAIINLIWALNYIYMHKVLNKWYYCPFKSNMGAV